MNTLPDGLHFEVKEGVAILTLDRPDKRNAMTTAMYEGIRDIMAEVKARDDVKVVILIGSGAAFCSGSDTEGRLLARIANGHHIPLEKSRAELLDSVMLYTASAIVNAGKPTIAAVNGVAAGSGLSLALACDIRLASDKARFGASWMNVGLIPDCGATYFLPRIIGVDRALKMIVTGDLIDAREAERIRLVTEVVPHDMLLDSAMALAQKIASGPSVAIELSKKAVFLGIQNDLATQVHFEHYAQNICFASRDFAEGVSAFKEKRKPRFSGT